MTMLVGPAILLGAIGGETFYYLYKKEQRTKELAEEKKATDKIDNLEAEEESGLAEAINPLRSREKYK